MISDDLDSHRNSEYDDLTPSNTRDFYLDTHRNANGESVLKTPGHFSDLQRAVFMIGFERAIAHTAKNVKYGNIDVTSIYICVRKLRPLVIDPRNEISNDYACLEEHKE
ncbi:hypothetical protein FOXG_04042 [Fusarium oxysporum f. sp. lycopersici 4287]|uniref:Uncharacterized protein n=2 Tax=Fusarium oxysporum TaxID=5507 RepID=A0A0J9UQM3_FUSO4|nr:hypothetical protein FOXG_04042 [Fusarium oxysporum f. sp. lycopersici 4287]KNB00481.1 hypothetical protein FOXG_04042 [Fusarium oxysporum f. sp. lycopersici 4287]